MADEATFYGTWKIVECVSLAGTVEPTGIEGTEFNLDESGDVSWKVPEDAEAMPFFSCETYEVFTGDHIVLKFFGTYAGHMIEFRVEVSDDLMLLTYERCCMLQCQKISSTDPKDDIPFSFLGALEEGYFSDITIKADTNKEFHVHKSILNLAAAGIDWSGKTPPLNGLPEDVVCATLHYLYAECLPPNMTESTARTCIKTMGKMAAFANFTKLCETFLKNTALKHQITSLVTDMHACADKIIDMFSGKLSAESQSVPDESIMTNPAKLCYVMKQALREAAVAGAKLIILCDIFSRRKAELSREERHEIIKYATSRLPVFMTQLKRFLEVCYQHSSKLTAGQRQDIAAYLVPEIETTLDTVTRFIVDTKEAIDQVIKSSSIESKQEKQRRGSHVSDVLGKTLKNALHRRELMKLKKFHEKTTARFMNLMQRKDDFSVRSQEEKVRLISKNLEQLIEEIPLFQVRIEELKAALDEKVTWREWKYLFKLGTSKVAWGLSKVQSHRPTLQRIITRVCDMVHRDQFNASLVSVGLRDSPHATADSAAAAALKSDLQNINYAQLSSVESLCVSPYARDSQMAKKALELLHSGEQTDMVFEIIIVQESGDVVIDHTQGSPVTRADRQREVDIHQIRAHRVIIAARCDWFRRALLSGMRESIDKKITVHDTNPDLFRQFLEYLYSGQLETNELSTEQLADMMALSDRYEMDSLKSVCEHALKHHLDEESALFLLSLADQFHARILRAATLNFVMEHPSVVESEIFKDLPDHLQTEVEEVIAWDGLEPRTRNLSGHSHTETPSTMSSTSEVDELMSALDLSARAHEDFMHNIQSTSDSSEEFPFVEDSGRLEACIAALRDIIGDGVTREELVRISIAADYDVNRALNFFFSS